MDTRRFRNHPSSEALAQVRWLGWVMIMMFVLVQTATGGTASGERSEQSNVQALADPTKSASGLQQAQLYLPVASSSESNFYDALVTTLPRVQQMPGRKARIVISTGNATALGAIAIETMSRPAS
jgi:hypothetical protein